MPTRRYKKVYIDSFGGGLNNFEFESNVDNDEASDLLNVDFRERGVVHKRFGYTKYGQTMTGSILGMASLQLTSSVQHIMVHEDQWYRIVEATLSNPISSGSALITVSSVTSWSAAHNAQIGDNGAVAFTGVKTTASYALQGVTGITNSYDTGAVIRQWVPIKTGLTSSTAAWNFTQIRNRVYGGNGVDLLHYYDGSGVHAVTTSTAPVGNQLATFKSRLFVAGDPSNPRTVYWSDPEDPNSYSSTAASLEVPSNRGDSVTSLNLLEDDLIATLQNAAFTVEPDSNTIFSATKLPVTRGALAHRAVSQVENALMYGSNDGVDFLGQLPDFPAGARGSNLSNTKVKATTDQITQQYRTNACSAFFLNRYRLSIPTGTTAVNDTEIIYDNIRGAFSVHDNKNVVLYNVHKDRNNQLHLYFANTSQVFEDETGTDDDGNPYTSYWESKDFNLDSPDLTKFWREFAIEVFVGADTVLNVDFYLDGASGSSYTYVIQPTNAELSSNQDGVFGQSLFGQGQFGGGSGESVNRYRIYRKPSLPNLKSRSVKIRVSNSSADQPWELAKLELVFAEMSERYLPTALKI